MEGLTRKDRRVGLTGTGRGLRLPPVLAPLAVLVAVLWVPAAAPARQCSDPCLQAARSAYRACASSAMGAFLDALDGCLELDHECVSACRAGRQDCRDGTDAGAGLADCDVKLVADKDQCRNRFPPGSKPRAACIFRAEVAGFKCRTGVLRGVVQEVKACNAQFKQCVAGCGPGAPPGGADTCRGEAKGAFTSMLAECRLSRQVTVSGCLDKDLTCLQGCGDTSDVCTAPTLSTLAAAIAACTTQELAAVAVCHGANPGGGPALDQCITAAQASATTCRDAASQAAAPGLAVCAQQYVGCVRACPPA